MIALSNRKLFFEIQLTVPKIIVLKQTNKHTSKENLLFYNINIDNTIQIIFLSKRID